MAAGKNANAAGKIMNFLKFITVENVIYNLWLGKH